jgi:hypothetical protein
MPNVHNHLGLLNLNIVVCVHKVRLLNPKSNICTLKYLGYFILIDMKVFWKNIYATLKNGCGTNDLNTDMVWQMILCLFIGNTTLRYLGSEP